MLIYLVYGVLQLSNVCGSDIPSEEVFDVEAINETIDDIPSHKLPNCDHTWMYISNGSCHCGSDICGTIRCSTDPVIESQC